MAILDKDNQEKEFLKEPLKPIEPEKRIEIESEKTKSSNIEDDMRIFKTVAIIPTGTPQNNFEKIQIFVSASTFRLYAWDETNEDWKYTSLT